VRISNSFDDFIFPIDQLQWLFIDTSNYWVITNHQQTQYLLTITVAFILIGSDCHLVVWLFYTNEMNTIISCNSKLINSACLHYI
jgi:hypothetical protein